MNDSNLTQLKIIVERTVRPVRASTHRKWKIREELLAHVSGVFEEESAKLGNQEAALARTQERFGSATELTGQLQAAIPISDKYIHFVEYLDDLRPRESTLRRATRLAMMMFFVCGAALLPAFLAQDRMHEWPVIPATAILTFGFTLMNTWMRDALYGPSGRSWFRAVLIGVASAFLIPGATFVVGLIYSREAWPSMMSVLPLLPLAVLLVWAPIVAAAYKTEMKRRYRREWDSLPIG